ncbi:hypothetical protein J6590_003022, partial [Homalodisca vitripennis]
MAESGLGRRERGKLKEQQLIASHVTAPDQTTDNSDLSVFVDQPPTTSLNGDETQGFMRGIISEVKRKDLVTREVKGTISQLSRTSDSRLVGIFSLSRRRPAPRRRATTNDRRSEVSPVDIYCLGYDLCYLRHLFRSPATIYCPIVTSCNVEPRQVLLAVIAYVMTLGKPTLYVQGVRYASTRRDKRPDAEIPLVCSETKVILPHLQHTVLQDVMNDRMPKSLYSLFRDEGKIAAPTAHCTCTVYVAQAQDVMNDRMPKSLYSLFRDEGKIAAPTAHCTTRRDERPDAEIPKQQLGANIEPASSSLALAHSKQPLDTLFVLSLGLSGSEDDELHAIHLVLTVNLLHTYSSLGGPLAGPTPQYLRAQRASTLH